MTPEKILEIARRYTDPETQYPIFSGYDGKPIGETTTKTYWSFCEEELLAFAKDVIGEERNLLDELADYLKIAESIVEELEAENTKLVAEVHIYRKAQGRGETE